MSQADNATSIQACAMRMTRLNTDGSIAYGQTAMMVVDSLISFEVEVQTEDSDAITVTSGCGNIAHNYSEGEKITGYTGTLQITNPDVELTEMATGGTLITVGGTSIGYAAPEIGRAATAGVCLEMWSKAWDGNGPAASATFTDAVITSGDATVTSATAQFTTLDVGKPISGPGIPVGTKVLSVTSGTSIELTSNATASSSGATISIQRPGQWWRWVFPLFKGKPSDFTLENAARENGINGNGGENKAIAPRGPLGDWPQGAPTWRMWHYWRDATPPTTDIGYQQLLAS